MGKLFAIALCLSLFGCARKTEPAGTTATTPETTAAAAVREDVVILYTNYVHTYIDGPLSYDVIAALKTQLIGIYGDGNVLLVDAGDHIQGTAFGSMDKGATIVELMNAAGYDTATLGNHDFDYGMDGAMAAIDAAAYSYISCNFFHEENGVRGEKVLSPVHFFGTPGGMEVAIVGITAPESFSKSTPIYFQDENVNDNYGIAGGENGADLYAAVQDAIDGIGGADTVITLGHLGDDPAARPWTSAEVIANVSGLDAFIDGHSHSTMAAETVTDKNGNSVLLTQTGEYFNSIGMMIIDGETGEITTDLITYGEILEVGKDKASNPVLNEDGEAVTKVAAYKFISNLLPAEVQWASDESVKALQDAWITQLGKVVGSTALTLDNYDAGGNRPVRSQETNTGDFCGGYPLHSPAGPVVWESPK